MFDIDATLDIHVEHHIPTGSQFLLHLTFEGSIEAPLIDLLIFQKIASLDVTTKLIRRKEIVIHAILLLTTWRPAGSTHAELQAELGMLLHQIMNDSAFPAPRRGRYN